MFVCICKAVSDREIRACASLGVCSLDELRSVLGVASCCGRCAKNAQQILAENVANAPDGALQDSRLAA